MPLPAPRHDIEHLESLEHDHGKGSGDHGLAKQWVRVAKEEQGRPDQGGLHDVLHQNQGQDPWARGYRIAREDDPGCKQGHAGARMAEESKRLAAICGTGKPNSAMARPSSGTHTTGCLRASITALARSGVVSDDAVFEPTDCPLAGEGRFVEAG